MSTFDAAFERVIGHEGGYSTDPDDRGNWTGGAPNVGRLKGTKYGISAAAYPEEDIEHLTLERAKLLYELDYWKKAGCMDVPPAIRFDLFDTAVNSGVGAAIRMLQRAVGTKPDGVIGPVTRKSVNDMDPLRLLARFNAERLEYMANAPSWAAHGKGWVRRVAANLRSV